MKNFQVAGHAASELPDGPEWKLVWADEFDGTELDQSKWNFRRNFWGKEFPAFTDRGVSLDGHGNLRIELVKNNDGSYSAAQLQTGSIIYDHAKAPGDPGIWPFGKNQEMKFLHRFGYYEIRCRLNREFGWWTAFWLQSPSVGAHPDPRRAGVECDIMESQEYAQDKTIRCGIIYDGYGETCKIPGHAHPVIADTPDDYHSFGVDWSEKGYDFYADGRLVHRAASPVSETEQFILVTAEPMGYRGVPSVADPALDRIALPDTFVVDHVRVFDRV